VRFLFTTFIYFSIILVGTSQRVYPKSAVIRLEKFNPIKDDGMLTFEIEVRMADCLESIELIDVEKFKPKKNLGDKIHDWWWFKVREIYDFNVSKRYTKEISDLDYSLKETDDLSEVIVMKCELIQLKSVFSRKETKKKLKIVLYSKSGKSIYEKVFILNRYKILEEGEIYLEKNSMK
jgi:hypothetical protein